LVSSMEKGGFSAALRTQQASRGAGGCVSRLSIALGAEKGKEGASPTGGVALPSPPPLRGRSTVEAVRRRRSGGGLGAAARLRRFHQDVSLAVKGQAASLSPSP